MSAQRLWPRLHHQLLGRPGRGEALELARVPRLQQQQQQPIPVVAAVPLDAPAPAPSTREEPLKADVARGAEAV